VTTLGNNSHGLFAQSVGGGGGSGGFSVSGAITTGGGALGASFGGSGAGGGASGAVTLMNSGDISTTGKHSYGIIGQSIGEVGGTTEAISNQLDIAHYRGCHDATQVFPQSL